MLASPRERGIAGKVVAQSTPDKRCVKIAAAGQSIKSQVDAATLLHLKRLKQRFEIAFAKALTSAAANDFKEHSGALYRPWLGENRAINSSFCNSSLKI